MSANFEQCQSDFLHKLLSEELLNNVSIVSLRDILAMNGDGNEDAAKIEAAYLVWTTPRNEKIGTGIMIGLASVRPVKPNVPSPDRILTVPIWVFMDVQAVSYHPQSSGLTAELISDYIDAILHQFGVEKIGSFYCVANEPDAKFSEQNPGIICRELKYEAEVVRSQFVQVPVPTLAEAALTITLTNHASYPSATIYYTTDGSFPGSGNSAARAYSAPFLVTSGTVVRWAAYQTSLRGSDAGQASIT